MNDSIDSFHHHLLLSPPPPPSISFASHLILVAATAVVIILSLIMYVKVGWSHIHLENGYFWKDSEQTSIDLGG